MTGSHPTTTVAALPDVGPFDRFLVRYRDGSAPALDRAELSRRLERAAVASALDGAVRGQPVRLQWLRRLAVGADLVVSDRPLPAGDARHLMQSLARDADVEYVEPDLRTATPPGPGRRLD